MSSSCGHLGLIIARISDIAELARQILNQDPIRAPLLLSLRGKVLFAEGQLFNRISAVVCRLIAPRVMNGGSRKDDDA